MEADETLCLLDVRDDDFFIQIKGKKWMLCGKTREHTGSCPLSDSDSFYTLSCLLCAKKADLNEFEH